MKNLKMLYIALIALVAGVFTACTTDFEPGPQKTGPQVSFEASNPKSLEFTGNAAENAQQLTLKRVEKDAELEVLLFVEVVTVEAEGNVAVTDPETYFTIPESVTFAAGEDTAVLSYTVNQEAFANDKTYAVNFVIADETITTPYGYAEWKVKYALNPWELVKDSKGNNAKGKFRGGDLLTGMFSIDPSVEVEVDIYEHKTQKGLYKIVDPWPATIAAGFEYESIEEAEADGLTFLHKDFIIDASNPAQVVFEKQAIGSDFGRGEMYVFSGYPDYFDAATGAGTLAEGVITFPSRGTLMYVPDYNAESVYYGNIDGLFRIVLPGVEIADYSLAVAYDGMDVAADNKTTTAKFKFTYGADVTNIKYMFVNGNVESDPTEALTTLFAGEDENIKSVDNFVQGDKEVGIKVGMESGIYTMVAAPADKNGALRTKEAIAYSFYFKGIGEAEERPCEFDAKMVLPSEYNPALVEKYPDQTTLIAMAMGKELKSVKYYFNASSIVATWEGTPEELVAAYGQEYPAEVLAKINSETGYADPFSKLNADTEYTWIAIATNNYGESKTIVSTRKTAAVTYDDYTGELAIGKYLMSCTVNAGTENEVKFDNLFEVVPNGTTNTDFVVKNFGANVNGLGDIMWLATYDATAKTLTLSGEELGYENYGNQFGGPYAYVDQAKTQALAFFSFANEESEGKDPCVLTVDATTKQVCALQNKLFAAQVVELASNKVVATWGYYEGATTTIAPYTEQPAGGENGGGENGGENGGASTASIMSVRAPFSSVTINKSIVAAVKSKFQSIKAAGVISNTKISGVRTVKLSVVEQYTPAKVKGFTKVKADAAAIRR